MTTYTRCIEIELGARLADQDGRKVFPAVLSTEVPVKRSDWQSGAYDEVLSHKASAINLERAPLPVLVSHDRWSLPVGIVDNVRLVDGKLRGDVSFGKSERAREIEADVEAGIIRNLSVGYSIEQTEERKAGDKKTITATRWTPHELSVVAVGADAGAGFGRSHMDANENPNENTENRDTPELVERHRCAGIARCARALRVDQEYAEQLIRDGIPFEQARGMLIDHAERTHTPIVSDAGRVRTWEPSSMQGRVGRATDTGPDFRAAAVDALLLRAGIPVKTPHAAAGDVDGNLYEIARTCVSRAGMTVQGSGPDRLMSRAMTTSDFPLILADVTHKAVRRGYEDDPASHRQWVRVAEVSDFRDQHRPILGSAPDLARVNEHGEYTHGSLDEDSTSYRVAKYGKIISLTWETLVNDNLSAFLRVQPSMGQAARRLEATTVYAMFAENSATGPTMQDGVVLFHSDHGNLASAGGLDAATLGAARALLRKQTAVGGGYLSLVPRFLIVPAELETDAEILLASATRVIASAIEADTPQWIARLELVVEPRLPDDAVYLAADNAHIDTVEMGLLSENIGGPYLEEEREFKKDVYSWKVRHVFGAKVLDWRGMVKVPISGG